MLFLIHSISIYCEEFLASPPAMDEAKILIQIYFPKHIVKFKPFSPATVNQTFKNKKIKVIINHKNAMTTHSKLKMTLSRTTYVLYEDSLSNKISVCTILYCSRICYTLRNNKYQQHSLALSP